MNTVQPASGPQLQTRLAVERTLLVWVRTGLAMMGFGFIVAKFGLFLREMAATHREAAPPPPALSLWIGTAMVLLGVLANLVAAAQHARLLANLSSVPRRRLALSPAVGLALLLALLGSVMVYYLLVIS
jgi:putative membrane protein